MTLHTPKSKSHYRPPLHPLLEALLRPLIQDFQSTQVISPISESWEILNINQRKKRDSSPSYHPPIGCVLIHKVNRAFYFSSFGLSSSVFLSNLTSNCSLLFSTDQKLAHFRTG